MALIVPAANFQFGAECGMGQQRYDLVCASEVTGSEQVRVLAPPRWTLRLVQPTLLRLGQAGAWQSLIVGMRGRVNVLGCWDPAMSVPQGTMRGTLTLQQAAAAGATSIRLGGGAAGSTMLAGDKLQLSSGIGTSQLVMVMANAVANGSGIILLQVEPPLRMGFAAGVAVTWDKPLAYFRRQGQSAGWTYSRKATVATGMALDLLETWTP